MSEKIRNRIDIMTDIETLGTKKDVAIIQLSAVAFDIFTGEKISSFNEYVDIAIEDGLQIDGSTLVWWLKTNKELLTDILTKETSTTIQTVLYRFQHWVKDLNCKNQDKYLWGNGILFDNRIIQESMRKYGLDYPIFYRNDRDMRTLVELVCLKENISTETLFQSFKDENLIQHNAIDDVTFQINVVCDCMKRLTVEKVIE